MPVPIRRPTSADVPASHARRIDELEKRQRGNNAQPQRGGGGGGATVTVAASDSNDRTKRRADFVCDGSNDDAILAEADRACGVVGRILLMEGVFHTTARLGRSTSGVDIAGLGPGTTYIEYNGTGVATVVGLGSTIQNLTVYTTGGTPTFGVHLAGDQAAALNVVVDSFPAGFDAGTGHLIGVTALNCTTYGIRIGEDAVLNGFRVIDCALGVDATAALHSVITSGIIRNAGVGIDFENAAFVIIARNELWTIDNEAIIGDSSVNQSCLIHDNLIVDAGSSADDTYAGIHAGGDRHSIRDNVLRNYAAANKLKYGVQVLASSNDCYVCDNDAFGAFVTAAVNDLGTATKTTSGNR